MAKRNSLIVIQILLMLNWVAFLQDTSNYLIVYIMVATAGIAALIALRDEDRARLRITEWPELLISALFSCAILLANWVLSVDIPIPSIGDRLPDQFFITLEWIVCLPILIIGGALCSFYILEWIKYRLITSFSFKQETNRTIRPHIVFLSAWGIMTALYLIVFYLAFYPGALTSDSLDQINQGINGVIYNNSPFYHTLLVSIFYKIGISIWGTPNAGLATFIVFQLLFVTLSYAYMTVTMYQMNLSMKTICMVSLLQLVLPYNICFTMALWKEALFGGSMLILIISSYRYLKEIGTSQVLNLMVMGFSGIGVCLFRHNGFYSYIFCVFCFLLIYNKKQMKALILLVGILLLSYILTRPVMRTINAHMITAASESSETTDSTVQESAKSDADSGSNSIVTTHSHGILAALSVPSMQMARVIVDCEDLSAEEKNALSNIILVDQVKENYAYGWYDSTSALIYQAGGNEYAYSHPLEVLGLYIKLGVSHPKAYIKGWSDMTHGYWSGGYPYWAWPTGIQSNELNISADRGSELAEALIHAYFWYFENTEILKPVISLGLYTWLVLLVMYIGSKKKDRSIIYLSVIPLSIVLILLICTPVFAENRYAYPVLECVPFLITAGLWAPVQSSDHS